jgi:hypothetical protein
MLGEKNTLTSEVAQVNMTREQVQRNQELERQSHHHNCMLVKQQLQHTKEDLKACDLEKADHEKKMKLKDVLSFDENFY